MKKIETRFTQLMNCRLPIIGAPMFLVSSVDMVVAISEAGGVGTFPALNFRPVEKYVQALAEIKRKTQKPIGVNIIVNKSNSRQESDVKAALEAGVELFITSLGSPKEVIKEAHKNGAKVFCDVTNLEHALKVQDLGADGVIAVCTGAGGHAGPISPFALIPWLKESLDIPVIGAGAIAEGRSWAAALILGAEAVSVGTRFIASHEAHVEMAYKEAVVKATPDDIVMTTRLSGTPAAVIRTPYVEKMGLELPWYLKALKENPRTKKIAVPLIHWLGMQSLEDAATKPSWKTVWSAGQSVGMIHEILSCNEIIDKMVKEYEQATNELPRTEA
jgi:nitronate monooxygenase